jgi:hypothetical protein
MLERRIAAYLAQLEAADRAEVGELIDCAAVKTAPQELP